MYTGRLAVMEEKLPLLHGAGSVTELLDGQPVTILTKPQ